MLEFDGWDIKLVGNDESDLTCSGRHGLYSISEQNEMSSRLILKLIDSLDMIYGLDLPQIVLLLSRYKITGHLNIISEQKNIYGISFLEGAIFKIDHQDPSTFLGQICIQEGYLTTDEVDSYIKQKELRFGEKLLKDNKVTVDQLSAVLSKQIVLRLTKLINNKLLKINFSKTEIEIADISISYHQIVELSFDWVFTCFSDQWLYLHYMDLKFTEFEFKKEILEGQFLSLYLRMIEFVGFNITSLFELHNTIQKIQIKRDIKVILRIVHLLVLIEALVFLKKTEERILETDVHMFSSVFLKANLQEKLNVLAVFTRESPDDITRLFKVFSDRIMNLKIDSDLKINLIHAVDKFIHNSRLTNQAVLHHQAGDAKGRRILSVTRELIGQNLYYKAFLELKKLDSNSVQTSKSDLYALWCLIGYAIETGSDLNETEIKNRIKKIKPDVKLDAEYFFVLGLYSIYKKEYTISDEHFRESYLRDPKLVSLGRALKRSEKSLFSQISKLFKFRKKLK